MKSMQNIKGKIKKAIIGLGLVGSLVFGAGKLNAANNPADLTTNYRLISLNFMKYCYDADNSQWVLGNIPLNEKTSAYGFGVIDSEGKLTDIQANLAIRAISKNNVKLDMAIQANYVPEIPLGITTSLDLSNQYGGLTALVDIKDLENTKVGARINIGKQFIGHLSTPVQEFQPKLGIDYNGMVNVGLAYEPITETGYLRLSKGIETKLGTFLPELRGTYTEQEALYGVGLGFIPKDK